jgi:hypothetical protein
MSCETLSINTYVCWGPTNAWLRAENMLRKKIIKFSSEKNPETLLTRQISSVTKQQLGYVNIRNIQTLV